MTIPTDIPFPSSSRRISRRGPCTRSRRRARRIPGPSAASGRNGQLSAPSCRRSWGPGPSPSNRSPSLPPSHVVTAIEPPVQHLAQRERMARVAHGVPGDELNRDVAHPPLVEPVPVLRLPEDVHDRLLQPETVVRPVAQGDEREHPVPRPVPDLWRPPRIDDPFFVEVPAECPLLGRSAEDRREQFPGLRDPRLPSLAIPPRPAVRPPRERDPAEPEVGVARVRRYGPARRKLRSVVCLDVERPRAGRRGEALQRPPGRLRRVIEEHLHLDARIGLPPEDLGRHAPDIILELGDESISGRKILRRKDIP